MFQQSIQTHNTSCWLVNTGWVGGKYGVGSRISLKHTRAIIDAIHSGALNDSDSAQWSNYGVFNLAVPTSVPGVPSGILDPSKAWSDEDVFGRERSKLAGLFRRAFRMFEADVEEGVRKAGPEA